MRRDYQRIGWRTCFVCGQLGYAYRYKGRTYVKHPVTVQPGGQQLTFADSGLQMIQKKQSTHYISKKSGRHYAISTTHPHKILKVPEELPTPQRIAVFPGAIKA